MPENSVLIDPEKVLGVEPGELLASDPPPAASATASGSTARDVPLRVMISSTVIDLPEHRKESKDACLGLGMLPIMMEHRPPIDAEAIAVSQRMVDEADIYLGIFAHRYGYVPAGHELSITEMEYDRAVERDIPRLIFLMHDEHSVRITDVETGDGAANLRRLKERLQRERVVSFFKSAEALGKQVIHGLTQLIPPRGPAPLLARLLGSVPPLPTLLIGREDALSDLKARVRVAADCQGPTPVQILTAVRGWPGVGKTTLAAALAHDRDIAITFPDGVLWVSLGQTPDLLSELAGWGRDLGIGDLMRVEAKDEAGKALEASKRLRAHLRNKRMLLILDDVWEKGHAILFQVGGRACATLITTRLDSVARALGPSAGDVYNLPVLSDENALKLLQTLAPTVVKDYPDEALDLVRELEGLPLALQVAGRLLNVEYTRGWSVSQLLSELRDAARLLEAEVPAPLIDLVRQTTPTVVALLQKSTDRLDLKVRECFVYLGVFAPKPATFDLDAMASVWDLQVADAKRQVDELINRGLLEPTGKGRFWMHGLLVAYAKLLFRE